MTVSCAFIPSWGDNLTPIQCYTARQWILLASYPGSPSPFFINRLHTREYSTLTHRGEGEPGKEPRPPVASDDLYQLILHMLCITWPWVRVVTGHGWARFLTRLSLSSMCQFRIFARVQIKKGEGEPG